MSDNCVKFATDESLVPELQKLYKQYGYKKYKMSRFEEYDLYVQNKSFLLSDEIITFNDTDGRLMALKPDVTLSIVKNFHPQQGYTEKLYYNENVYRVSNRTHEFRELMQTGLECIGEVDLYSMSEVIGLAVESLERISGDYILDISHMGFLAGLLDETGLDETGKNELLKLIGEKNPSELKAVCEANSVNAAITDRLISLCSLYGPIDESLCKLKELSVNQKTDEALLELEKLCAILKIGGKTENINLDFSVVNDMTYYNGIIFQGFVNGVPGGVLSGGRYDKLLEKFGKTANAIGFAVYLDMLDYLHRDSDKNDVDVLILYSDSTDAAEIAKKAKEISDSGQSVRVAKARGNIRYGKEIIL